MYIVHCTYDSCSSVFIATYTSPITQPRMNFVSLQGEPIDLRVEPEIGFKVNLQKASDGQQATLPLFPDKKEDQEEFLMTLTSEIKQGDIPWLEKVQNEQVDFLLVLDSSGSMGGKPWQQVQCAVSKISRLVENLSNVHITYLTYASRARFASQENILQTRAGGCTSFVSAFRSIEDHMRQTHVNDKLVIIFMTDGCATDQAHEIALAKEKMQSTVETLGFSDVIFHVLGFNSNHNDAFLESLSILGTADGTYSFVPENTSSDGLENRLYDLVHGALALVGKSAFVELTFDEDSGHKFLGQWFGTKDGVTNVTLHVSSG